MSKTVKAVYPGTFDPLTLGHENILVRSSRMFDHVILAVALAERIELAQMALKDHANIEVMSFEGLVKDFALEQGATVMIRGVRSMTDFDYESQLAGMNRLLAPEVETVFLNPEAQFLSLSSTLIREIASLGGQVGAWVSPCVETALKEKCKRS